MSKIIQPQILVVEDDAIAQIVVKHVFRKFDCKLDLAKSAEEGLERYQQNDYALIFIDIGLPGLKDGIDMVEAIRGTEKGRDLPLIMLTAHMHEKEGQRLYDAKATKVVIKPLTWPVLKDIIVEFLPENAAMLAD